VEIRIALIGDYNPSAIAHRAIPLALRLAGQTNNAELQFDWKHTSMLTRLNGYHGIWCVPASPYSNEASAIDAIRLAREEGIPFLGTCGGFQHAVLEFARNVLGLSAAQHAETSADGKFLVISPLSCPLEQTEQLVYPVPATRLARLCGLNSVRFEYNCRFGLNPVYEHDLETAGMRVAARDVAKEVRAVELINHRFFMATLFQPERWALKEQNSCIVDGFVKAAMSFSS
jgi:CTP synthase (UTP-ammonia lyase)